MKLFDLNTQKIKEVGQVPFKLEKDIQKLVETNIETFFGLRFIVSEFPVDKYRIDTMCYNEETNSFVIIEYKKGDSYSVIDQGYTYLQLLLNHKSDFVLMLSNHYNKVFNLKDIDWSQSRILFVSPSFNSYQKDSVNFKDLPFELWEITRYSNNNITLNQHRSNSRVSIDSINTESPSSTLSQVSREVKVYSEEYHLNRCTDETIQVYNDIRNRILEMGSDITFVPRQNYIGFKRKSNFVDIEFTKNFLKVTLNLRKGQLNDPMGLTEDITDIGHWGNGDYRVNKVNGETDLDYLMVLIKSSYKNQS